jgi:hypothetical protein
MATTLSSKDLDFILESLKYTKIKFETYDLYPSHEFKLQRIKEVETVISKVQNSIKGTK